MRLDQRASRTLTPAVATAVGGGVSPASGAPRDGANCTGYFVSHVNTGEKFEPGAGGQFLGELASTEDGIG